MVQETISYFFMVAHLVLGVMAIRDYGRNKLSLFPILAAIHFLSIPLIFLYEQLLSMLSLPLIMVTLIVLILESRQDGA